MQKLARTPTMNKPSHSLNSPKFRNFEFVPLNVIRLAITVLIHHEFLAFSPGRPCRNMTILNSNTTNVPGVYEDVLHIECNLGFSFTQGGSTDRIFEYDTECLATGEWSRNITCEGR